MIIARIHIDNNETGTGVAFMALPRIGETISLPSGDYRVTGVNHLLSGSGLPSPMEEPLTAFYETEAVIFCQPTTSLE